MGAHRYLLPIAAAVLMIQIATPSYAQDWPSARPLTLVIPFAPGGPTDVIGRVMAPTMSEVIRQQIVIENMGGAGGMLGSTRIARAAPDGYQFVLGGLGTFVLNQLLYKKPPFDTATDLAPVALVADQPQVLITRKDFPAADLREFVAHARATPTLLYGSAGAGSASHACAILLNAAMGTNLVHVPFRGGAPAMQELLAGRTDFQCELISTALPQIRAQTVKLIAALTRERISVLPDLPTAREQGLTDVEAEPWFGFFLPKATPEPIVRKLNEAVVTAMSTPAVSERMASLGVLLVAPERRSPGYLGEFVKREIVKWSGPVKASGVVLD
jgi:tripartite-type tricarboxylate transporter receptor subunit TctC